MIRSIIGMSLRFWMLLIAIAVGVMAVGIVQLRSAPVDVLPEFTPPYVEVQTEALGLSANEVEEMITVPLEADLLNGIEGVDVIRSGVGRRPKRRRRRRRRCRRIVGRDI